MKNKIKIGITGLGGFGIVCSHALDMSDKAEIIAIQTRNKEKIKKYSKEFNAKGYSNYEEMIKNQKLDAVCITTPQHIHSEQAIKAMNLGLHVFCTKPMALTIKEADKMIDTAKKNNVNLDIGFHYRYDEQIKKIRELVKADEIGTPFYTISSIQSFRGADYWESGPWRKDPKYSGGGAITLNYSHDIDFLQWYFGEVKWIIGSTESMVHNNDVEDVANAIIKFKNGVISNFTCSTATYSTKSPRLEIFGTKGVISLVTTESKDPKLPYPTTKIIIHKNGKWRTIKMSESSNLVKKWENKLMPWTAPLKGLASIESLDNNINEFLKCIINNKPPIIDGKEGKKSLAIINAIYESSKTGKRISIKG